MPSRFPPLRPPGLGAVAGRRPPRRPLATDPSNRPSAWTSIWLPRGRGAEPQVDTTVASAIDAPFQAAAALRTESLSAMIFVDLLVSVIASEAKHLFSADHTGGKPGKT